MSKISDKEIELKGSVLYQTSPWFRSVAGELLAAQEEISKLREERDLFLKQNKLLTKNNVDYKSEITKIQKANATMLEVLKRITTIVTENEEAKYHPVGTVRLIGSIASGVIADIEKGAES